ncbi:MAG TPA: hypothetical protein VHB02_14885 [Acidimicrobiales bacterium]|nr:hypothetical protein [Acidimicrobiales bacterium]
METVCIALQRPEGAPFSPFAQGLIERAPVVDRARSAGAVAAALDVVLWPERTRIVEAGARDRRPFPVEWDAFLQFRFDDGGGRRFLTAGPVELGLEPAAMAVYAFETRVVAGEPIGVTAGSAKEVTFVTRASGLSVAEAVAHHRSEHVDIALSLGTLFNRYSSSGALTEQGSHWDLMVEQWYDTTGRLADHVRRHSATDDIRGHEEAFVGWLHMYFAAEVALWGPRPGG